MKIIFKAPKYPDDLIHIDRWMCSNCGLIFDFSPESAPDELGWISYDPPLDNVNIWMDDDGNYFEEDIERAEICPRCACNLSENPLRRVFVSAKTTLNDIKPIIQQGEGLQTEFKVIYPETDIKLAKEIAAFATTQGGKIFLGINDNGEAIGVKGVDTPKGKDDLTKRIRNLAEKIKPKVDISVDFVFETDIYIVIITVRKGVMPLYEYEGKVYIRFLESSREATFDEKIRLQSDWLERRPKTG